MAVLKYKDASKMSSVERKDKLSELKFELVKANTPANKSNSKIREIKKAIARIKTFENASSGGGLGKK